MTKSISVIAYHRPQYLRKCLDALEKARGVRDWRVTVSIDGPPDDLTRECFAIAADYGCFETADHGFVMECVFQNYHLGIQDGWVEGQYRLDHPSHIIASQFQLGSQLHLYLEEDCVIAPDGLEWVDAQSPWLFREDSWLVALADDQHSVTGDEGYHREMRITSPWAWATTPEHWKAHIAPKWNANTEHPRRGWDWSLTDQMASAGAYSLAPNWARAYNIGRECGVHGGAEWYDEHLAGMAWTGGE